jgi:hypothetical protein
MKLIRSSGHKNIWLNDWDCDSRTAIERKWKNNVTIPWIAKYSGKRVSETRTHPNPSKSWQKLCSNKKVHCSTTDVRPSCLSCCAFMKWFLWLFLCRSVRSIKKSNVQSERLMGISFQIFQAILSPLWLRLGDSLSRKGEGVFRNEKCVLSGFYLCFDPKQISCYFSINRT